MIAGLSLRLYLWNHVLRLANSLLAQISFYFIIFFSFLTFQNVNVRVLVDLALKDLTAVILKEVRNRRGFTDSLFTFLVLWQWR